MMTPRKILLIDDAEEHLLVCQIILELRGYAVKTMCGMATIESLFELVCDYQPDLILTDYDMPGFNGDQTIRMIKQVSRFRHIRVVYFSGLPELANVAVMSGADDYLSKPLRTESLLAMIDKHLPACQ